eukprot:59885-Pyramimonas_sp.AAC.1
MSSAIWKYILLLVSVSCLLKASLCAMPLRTPIYLGMRLTHMLCSLTSVPFITRDWYRTKSAANMLHSSAGPYLMCVRPGVGFARIHRMPKPDARPLHRCAS